MKLQAKHAKAHVGKQGKAAGGASHRMQHTQNHCQSDATYQMTDTQAGSPQKPFPPNESSHQPIPHDLHLQRLQAAALAWRTAAQTTADAQQARGADEIMFTAAPLEESRMQSNTYTASNEGISVSHKQHQPSSIQQSPQWQPQGRPPSQHQNAHTLLSAAEYQSSAQIHGGQHVDNSVAAAARWTSPAMQQGTHLAGAYTSPAALYDNMETSSPSAAFVERDLLAIPTASGEAMENSASELMWGWDERWPYNAREPVMHNSHNYVGHISENMMEVAPPPPPYMHGIGQKPKATWWAAMKGEAHPCKLR